MDKIAEIRKKMAECEDPAEYKQLLDELVTEMNETFDEIVRKVDGYPPGFKIIKNTIGNDDENT